MRWAVSFFRCLYCVAALPSKRRDPSSESNGAGLSKKQVEDLAVMLVWRASPPFAVFTKEEMPMSQPRQGNPLGSAPIPRLMVKFAVPSIIAMLVGSLYNIDQWGYYSVIVHRHLYGCTAIRIIRSY